MTSSTSLPAEEPVVAEGMHVVLDLVLEEGVDHLEVDIVEDDQADFSHGFLGINTPLAQAILGLTAHQSVPYRVGDGREIRVIHVSPSEAAPPEDVKARRQEVIRKAIERSDRTNAMIFASSFSGKWGDYDPTGFSEDEEKPEDQEN